jgi:site-specific recombinase XerD
MVTATRHDNVGSEAAYAPLLASYRRELETSRGLSPATVRNYLADLVPFFEYLENENVGFGRDGRELKRFVLRDGPPGVSATYRQLIRDYVSWLVEDRRVTSGRSAGQRGHARASVVRTLAALRGFMRYLIDHRKMPDAPLWQPRSSLMRRFTPKPTRRLPDIVSANDAVRLVEAPDPANANGPKPRAAALRDRAVLELLYGGGLRVSEVSGLNQRDVTLANRSARVWGKGSKARMVPLGGPAVDAVTAYLNDARKTLADANSGEALFLNQRGGRLTPRSVQLMVQRYAASADLRPGVHPHTLRHSFATHLLDGGADLRVVQELLGHSTPSATQVYTHVSQTEARKAYMSAHPLAQPAPQAGEPTP